MAAGSRRRRLEPLRALVAEEVVAAEDVVDLEAFGAGVPFADVALEKGFVADDSRPLLVAQEGLGGVSLTVLAGGGHRPDRRAAKTRGPSAT